jgi:hypothetical protein
LLFVYPLYGIKLAFIMNTLSDFTTEYCSRTLSLDNTLVIPVKNILIIPAYLH